MDSEPERYYDAMGEGYIKKGEKSLFNAYYERPAIKSLLPEVADKNVLEIGCAGGAITEWLVTQGARVIAVDISEEMVKYARERIGSKAEILKADASEPLDFLEPGSVDVVLASLVLHYIWDWFPVFQEFHQVLREDGEVVMSTHHPHADWKWLNNPSYFEKSLLEEIWNVEGEPYKVKYYHRTLMEMFDVFRKSGFYVDVLSEPFPVPEGKSIDSDDYEYLMTKPHFLFMRLRKLKNSCEIRAKNSTKK